MALSIGGLEPVEFGGVSCTPKLNTETKMRLSQIRDYDESADEVLASAFPKDESYVKEFLTTRMTTLDKQTLHAYLMGGDLMIKQMIKKIEGAVDDL